MSNAIVHTVYMPIVIADALSQPQRRVHGRVSRACSSMCSRGHVRWQVACPHECERPPSRVCLSSHEDPFQLTLSKASRPLPRVLDPVATAEARAEHLRRMRAKRSRVRTGCAERRPWKRVWHPGSKRRRNSQRPLRGIWPARHSLLDPSASVSGHAATRDSQAKRGKGLKSRGVVRTSRISASESPVSRAGTGLAAL